MHHFQKQDLSANSSLPNFADDLNAYKNPNVSTSSTFNILAYNFCCLDNNFLNLNGSEQPFISKSSNADSISISYVNKSIPQNLTFSGSKIKYCLASSTEVQGKTLKSNSMSFLNNVFYLQFLQQTLHVI